MIYIDGNPLKNVENKHYLLVKIERNIWTGKNKYIVDVGQPDENKSEFTTEKGKILKFNSEVDVMNYLHFEGWFHKNTYTFTNPGTSAQVHKILFTKMT